MSIYTHAPIMSALVHTPPLLSKRKRRKKKKKKKKKKMELGLGDLCIMICVQRVYDFLAILSIPTVGVVVMEYG